MRNTRESLSNIFCGNEWPELLDVEQNSTHISFQLSITPELKWLQGHFPSQPVLAGVVQTHWACSLALHIFTLPTNIRRIDNLKFHNVITPPQKIRLTLIHNLANEKNLNESVTFRYMDSQIPEHIFSEGKLVF